MFEDDDEDFSFLDEDFLTDALQPATVKKTPSKNREVLKVIQEKASITTNQVPLDKKTQDVPKKNLKTSGRFSFVNKGNCNKDVDSEEAALDIDFETNDFFYNIDDDDFGIKSPQNTPPDSHFTSTCISQKELDEEKQTHSATTSSSSDFRTKILQSLQVNKEFNKPKSIGSVSNQGLAKIVESEAAIKSGAESRKRAYTDDSSAKSFSYDIKRKQFNTISEVKDSEFDENIKDNSSFFTPLKLGQTSVRKSVSPGGPVIQKRKFPGPAGLLPQLGSKAVPVNIQLLNEEDSSPSVSKDIVCSQSSADEFLCGPWRQMSNDLEQNQPNQISPLGVFNIKWVLRRASLRGHASVRKIPFLAVMVRSIDAALSDATVVLKDKTGEMNGTIANSVLEEYVQAITPGCVMLLRDVTLLSPVSLKSSLGGREPVRRHYLNITLNTVHTIYTSEETGHVVTTTVSDADMKELLKQATTLKLASTPRAIVEEEEEEELVEELPDPQQQLFSNVNNYGNPTIPFNHGNNNYRGPRPSNTPVSGSSLNQNQIFTFNSPANSNPRPTFNSPINSNPRPTFNSPMNSNPRPTFNSPMSSNPRPTFNSPMNSNPRPFRYPGNEVRPVRLSPRCGASTVAQPTRNPNSNGIARPQRFSFQPSSGMSSQGYSKATGHVTQPTNIASSCSTINSTQVSSPIFRSQQEEKEVNDILENIDEDSLFGDF